MRKIAVIDADLIGRKRHRFPNLVCMKLSGYHKSVGNEVLLKTDYESLESFDQVYILSIVREYVHTEGKADRQRRNRPCGAKELSRLKAPRFSIG